MNWKFKIFVIFAIALAVFMCAQLFLAVKNFDEDGGVYFNKFNKEYLDLFSENAKRKFSDSSLSMSRMRNSFGFVDYDNSYQIIIYKFNLSAQKPVNSIIQENQNAIDGTDFNTYMEANQDLFKLDFKPGKVNGISEIILTTDDRAVKVFFKNDSAAYYYLPKEPFSVKYGKDSAVDFFIKPKSTFGMEKNFPKSLLFFKRSNSLYFLMMAPINADKKLPVGLLYSLLKN